jgi:DNA replication and repair protein RecF
LAQYRFVQETLGIRPVLLLDDLFDKLDSERMRSLLELFAEEGFGQIIITDTDKEGLEKALRNVGRDVRFFEVEKGSVSPWNTETTNVL